MHKRNFHLETGTCLNDDNYSIITFKAKPENGNIYVMLPEPDVLDEVLGTQKWMVRKPASQVYEQGGAAEVELVKSNGCIGSGCGDGKLDW
jgi:nitrite reductase (NAD(P)H)